MKSLDGVKVLDLGSYIAAVMLYAAGRSDGADVIRVEPPNGKVDREMGPFFPNGESITYGSLIQRNKKNITLNFKI